MHRFHPRNRVLLRSHLQSLPWPTPAMPALPEISHRIAPTLPVVSAPRKYSSAPRSHPRTKPDTRPLQLQRAFLNWLGHAFRSPASDLPPDGALRPQFPSSESSINQPCATDPARHDQTGPAARALPPMRYAFAPDRLDRGRHLYPVVPAAPPHRTP